MQWQTNGLVWVDNLIGNMEMPFHEACNVDATLHDQFNASNFAQWALVWAAHKQRMAASDKQVKDSISWEKKLVDAYGHAMLLVAPKE